MGKTQSCKCALMDTALILAALSGSGFRDGNVPATRLTVVFALSGYLPGNARAALVGYCAWLPCEGG